MKEKLLNSFFSVVDSPLYKPFLIFIFIIASSFVVPSQIVFDDESSLPIRAILLWGASFFLVGWLIGSWSKK